MVVLVADRTLSASYKVLFEGIFATMQTTKVPSLAMRRFVSPPARTDRWGRAVTAPLGLRRLEASLLAGGKLTADQVVVTTPERLPGLLGPHVKAVGVSSSDPLGCGMSNTTTSSFWGGRLYTAHWMERMMGLIRRAKERWGFAVVAGGAGAWQYLAHSEQIEAHGIDVVFDGFCEAQAPRLFGDLVEGRPVEPVVREAGTLADLVQPIRGASLLGIIELSRGCGRGCGFCTSSSRRMEHLDVETILADLRTNVAAGVTNVVSGSEDLFRYGSSDGRVDFARLHALLTAMREVEGLSFMQIDHANIASVAQLDDEQLREARRLLSWRRASDYLWVNMGVESANGHLVAANSPGKLAPYRPEDWEDLVLEVTDKTLRTGFYPVLSLVLGLPGETLDDVVRTRRLVERLDQMGGVIFPVFHEPLDAQRTGRFSLETMTDEHLDLYTACYEINFRRVPALFWDNQRAGGTSWAKRTAMQLLGKLEVRAWRKNFARVRRAIRERSASAEAEAGPDAA